MKVLSIFKGKWRVLVGMVFLLSFLGACQEGDELPVFKKQNYYYSFEEKIPLYTVENRYVFRYDTIPEKNSESLKLKGMFPEISISWKDDKTAIVDLTNKGASVEVIDYLMDFENLYTIQSLFKLKEGLEMPVTDEFVVGFSQINEAEVRNLHKLLKVAILETNSVFQHLRVPRGADALKIANQYQESGSVDFAHPNFLIFAEPF
jgi:hypothetical protein